MHSNDIGLLLLMAYPVILLGLLIATIVVEFIPKRRHLGSFFIAAAIGSIPGFIGGMVIGAIVEQWIRQQDLSGWIPATNSEFVAFALSNVPWSITAVSTLIFAVAGVYVVYLRRNKNRRVNHTGRFNPRFR